MKTLFVLHDLECEPCGRFCFWLSRQATFVELRFIPLSSPEAECRFPGLEKFLPGEPLVAVSDEGAVYLGPAAWVMCLYALEEYREWSLRLASPALLPLARVAGELISRRRLNLSRWAGHEEELAEALRQQQWPGAPGHSP